MWTTQVWFLRLLRPLTDHPLILPKGLRTLTLPFNQDKVHPLQKTLILLACKVSGNRSHQEAFRKKLPKPYCNPGEGVRTNSTPLSSTNGFCFAVDPYQATHTQALDFMTELCEQGLGYSAMNTVRSALSQVVHIPSGVSFGELPIVKQFLKGVFQQNLHYNNKTLSFGTLLFC